MSDLPRTITTDGLRSRGFDLPAVAPEVIGQLHPYGVHLIFETMVHSDVETPDVTVGTVLAVTERGDVVRFLHQFREREWSELPTLDRHLVEHARLAEESAVRSVVDGLQAVLASDRGFQQEFPFE